MWRRPVSFALVAGSVAVIGCGHNVRPRSYDPPGEQLILRDEIEKSGATDAWDVVRRLTHMTTATTISGEPSRMYRRGHGSIVIRETPLVVVDGTESSDLKVLTGIRADQIVLMRVLTGPVATTHYGARGGAGAIIIQTIGTEQQSASSDPSQ